MTSEEIKNTEVKLEIEEEEEYEIRTFLFARWIVHRPFAVCFGSLFLPIILTLVFFIALFLGGFNITTDVLIEDRSNIYWKREAAYFNAQDEVKKISGPQKERSLNNDNFLVVIFEVKRGDNIFTADRIQRIREIEQHIIYSKDYNKFCFAGGFDECLPPFSVMNYFYPEEYNCSEVDCESLGTYNYNGKGTEMQDIQTTLELMITRNGSFEDSDNFVDTSFGSNSLKSRITKIIFYQGLPLAGYENDQTEKEKQEMEINKWQVTLYNYLKGASNDRVRVLFYGRGISDHEFLQLFLRDSLFALASFFVVFFITVTQLRSFWIASVSMMHIFMSFPIGLVVYQYIFQFTYIGTLHILTLYIILGIGVDNVFIFYDTWIGSQNIKQCSDDLEKRMAWTYKRAGKAMLVTSSTTFVAFVSTAITPFVALQTFGIFAALLIAINYLFTITFLPSVVSK